jgi:nucleoside-diphosphate-sugar epimerase
MRYVVTGCAGFIGSHVTEALLADGHDVVGIDCFNDNYARRRKLANLEQARDFDAFEFVPVDMSRGDLADLVEGCDAVVHLAAEPGVRPSWGQRYETYLRNNVLATHHLLTAMAAAGDATMVYASSSSVYGQAETFPTSEGALPRPLSPYGVTKLDAEHLCHLYHVNHGVRVVSLRYFSVYGPRQRPDMAFSRFIEAGLAGTTLTVFGDGEQTRDFTFVGDVVAATIAASRAPELAGRVYNIGGGSQVSVNETLGLIGMLIGHPLDVHHAGVEAGDVKDTGADTARAREDLGFRPLTSLAEGLAAQVAWSLDPVRASAPLRGSG